MIKIISKKQFRKTKRGQCIFFARKAFLRSDIHCGCPSCSLCFANQKSEDVFASVAPSAQSSAISGSYILIPDVTTTSLQVDLLRDVNITNVVLLQSVLQEVGRASMKAHGVLRDLVRDKAKHFCVFSNEFHSDCYLPPTEGEPFLHYQQRLVMQAVKWYAEHLQKANNNQFTVVLLTDDNLLKDKANESQILAMSVENFVCSLPADLCLIDKVVKMAAVESFTDASYAPHLSLSEIQSGLKSGKLFEGTFFQSRFNGTEGHVRVHSTDQSVLIHGIKNINRALHDDTVAVEILPREEWKKESDIVLLPEEQDQVEDAAAPDDPHLLEEDDVEQIKTAKAESPESKAQVEDVQPTGRIVGIVRRKFRQYCGVLQPSQLPGANFHLFIPAEKRLPKIRIETRQADRLNGKRIVVAIDRWLPTSRYPTGHFVRLLGNAGDKATENELILLERDVPHESFSQAVLACLPKLPWIITEKDLEKRMDLRQLDICSIDPPGCTDIDDALHYRDLPNGNYEVGVHIADVSHFIRPGTAIDREAAHRGTTVYLTDQRIDMVPELLSSNLCSLRQQEERFAFSAIWELNKDAEIVATKFTKSIIKSKFAFTYAEAQARINDLSLQDSLTCGLRKLLQLSKTLRKKRADAGALTLASSEIRFNLDSETHDPISVQSKKMLETNSLVEEFMLLANCSVAEFIWKHFPDCAVLRRHPIPTSESYTPLLEAAASNGFQIKTNAGLDLAKSLDAAVVPSAPYFNTMLRMIATRCMTQAIYFASGTLAYDNFLHFGLAAPIYTHFTSPIRRYPDVLVHRLLAAAINVDSTYPDLLDKRKMQDLCNHMNHRHRMAQYASRDSVSLHTVMYFAKSPSVENGYVLFVKENALQILVPKYGLEVSLGLKDAKGNKAFEFDKANCLQRSKVCGDVTLKMFDSIKIYLSVSSDGPAAALRNRLTVKLVSPKVEGFSVEPPTTSTPVESEHIAVESKRQRKA